jgi:hypothetical protein
MRYWHERDYRGGYSKRVNLADKQSEAQFCYRSIAKNGPSKQAKVIDNSLKTLHNYQYP